MWDVMVQNSVRFSRLFEGILMISQVRVDAFTFVRESLQL